MALFDPIFADSIASIESGGKYDLLGPVTKSGDQAYGKYQVMGANIPAWTKEILGQPLTPEEFLKNPQAQEAVFQGKFGQYVEKYGPEGAAQAWFAGPGGVGKLDRKDQLGTSVADYGRRFMVGIGKTPALPPAQDVAALPPTAPPQPQPFEPQKPLQPQPLNIASQLPSFQWTPQQQAAQQIAQEVSPEQPSAAPLQIAHALRQPIDLARLHAYLTQLPAAIRPYSFRG